MKPLEPGHIEISPEQRERIIQDCVKVYKMSRAKVEESLDRESKGEVWINDVYQVLKRPAQKGVVWLSIKRLDKEVCHDWRDFQAIKNQLIGPECEGLEVYPAESRLIDAANQYHLWVFTDPTYRLPFGFDMGRTVLQEGTRDVPTREIRSQRVSDLWGSCRVSAPVYQHRAPLV